MKKYNVVVPVVGGILVAAGSASAAVTELIDFSTLATDVATYAGIAVTGAVGLGAAIMAAKLCWRFFKSFGKG